MRILFCADPWNARQPDAMYVTEAEAAEKAGLDVDLISFEMLVEEKDASRAVRRIVPASTPELGIYRGWMLRPEVYARLHVALREKNIQLINSPDAYKHCHYLPEAYSDIAEYTPRSVWLHCNPDVSLDTIMAVMQPFGEQAVIVKDFVKSRKHEWYEACYIPSAADREAVARIVTRFFQLQGDDLHEGLVFREFVEFEPLVTHSRSGMPLTREFRLFFLDGRLMLASEYWEEGNYGQTDGPPITLFSERAARIPSRFFSMDVAKCRDGRWLIVELGDGQVAGLPQRMDVYAFYRALAHLA